LHEFFLRLDAENVDKTVIGKGKRAGVRVFQHPLIFALHRFRHTRKTFCLRGEIKRLSPHRGSAVLFAAMQMLQHRKQIIVVLRTYHDGSPRFFYKQIQMMLNFAITKRHASTRRQSRRGA